MTVDKLIFCLAEILAAFKNYSYGAWIGYFVDVRSELFLWADNSNPVFVNWDEGQPNSPVRLN